MISHWRAYSCKQGELVTHNDRRRCELELENSSPPLARLCESNGVVTRWVLAGQGGGSQSEKPFVKLGTVNPELLFEMSWFANYRICPGLLAPRHSFLQGCRVVFKAGHFCS